MTYHISEEVDQDRDFVVGELKTTDRLVGLYTVTGLGPTRAHSGRGDVYWADGNVMVAEIAVSLTP